MKIFALLFFLTISYGAFTQKSVRLTSPNGEIGFSFHVTDTDALYNVSYKNKTIINNSSISLDFLEGGQFKKNLKFAKPVFRNGEEDYELITGKSKFVRQSYH